MPTAVFEDGTEIEFEGEASPQQLEEAYQMAKGGASAMPTQAQELPFYEQARLDTEAKIADRPSLIKGMMHQIPQSLAKLVGNPQSMAPSSAMPMALPPEILKLAATGLGAFQEASESIPANAMLAMQRGQPGEMGGDIASGLQGNRPSQLGDVMRASGLPVLSSEPAAVAIGTAAFGADMLSQPSIKATNQFIGLPKKIGAVISDATIKPAWKSMVDPITEYPYRKSLELQDKLIGYFRGINKDYGNKIEQLADDMDGVVPTDFVTSSLRGRLQEANFVDQMGQVIPGSLNDSNPIERALVSAYEDYATKPEGTLPFKQVMKQIKHFRERIGQAAKQKNRSINGDERVVSGVIHDLAVLMEGENTSLADINKDYAGKRQMFNAGNKVFKVFKGEYDTKTGERVLSNIYKQDSGTMQLLSDLEKNLGTPILKQSRAYSAAKSLGRDLGQFSILGTSIGKAGSAAMNLGRLGTNLSGPKVPESIKAAVFREAMRTLKGKPSDKDIDRSAPPPPPEAMGMGTSNMGGMSGGLM